MSSTRVLELKQYYLSMYRFNMLRLYEAGYIDDPTLFNRKQIIKNIVDLKITGLFDVTGKIHLSSDWLRYAKDRNHGEDQKDFLSNLIEVMKYREYNNDLDIFYEAFNKTIHLQMYRVGINLQTRTTAPIHRGTLMTLVPSGKTIQEVNIREALWVEAMKVLEIPESDWFSDGLFDSNLSHEAEVQHINILLNGLVHLSGKYSKNLSDWLFAHKWSNSKINNEKKGMIDYLYTSSSDGAFEALSDILEPLDESSVIGFIGDTVYIERDMENYKIPISYFAVCSCVEDILICSSNAIYGYTGEAYDRDYLDDEEIPYIGLPIKVVCDDLTEKYVYDREQVDTPVESWFKASEVDFEFEEGKRINNPFRDEDSLQYELFEIYVRSQNGELCSIKADKYTYKEIEQAKKKVAKKLKEVQG